MKVFKRIVSHASLILSLMVATFEVLNIFNPAMGFVSGPLPSLVRYLFCAFAFANAVAVIIQTGKEDVAAKREKASGKEEEPEREKPGTAPVRTAPPKAAAAKTSAPAPVRAPVSPEKRAAAAMKETVQSVPEKNVPAKAPSRDALPAKTAAAPAKPDRTDVPVKTAPAVRPAEPAPARTASPVKKEGPKTETPQKPLPVKQKTEESAPAVTETKTPAPAAKAPATKAPAAKSVPPVQEAPAGSTPPRVTTDVGRVRIRSEKTASVRTTQTSPEPAAKKDVPAEKKAVPAPAETVQTSSGDRVLGDDEEL